MNTVNRTKSRVRGKVEHIIAIIERALGFQKVRYHGLAKNLHRLEVTAASSARHTDAKAIWLAAAILVAGTSEIP